MQKGEWAKSHTQHALTEVNMEATEVSEYGLIHKLMCSGSQQICEQMITRLRRKRQICCLPCFYSPSDSRQCWIEANVNLEWPKSRYNCSDWGRIAKSQTCFWFTTIYESVTNQNWKDQIPQICHTVMKTTNKKKSKFWTSCLQSVNIAK